jgi:hypothetical protein
MKSQKGRATEIVTAAAVIILLPVLYVLSFGPMARLMYSGVMPHSAFRTIYAPLIWPAKRSPAVRSFWSGTLKYAGCRLKSRLRERPAQFLGTPLCQLRRRVRSPQEG